MKKMLRVFKGLNRNVFDPCRQMLRRRCLFCGKTDLNWQVVLPRWLFVPNPALMSWSRGGEAKGGSLSFTKRRGREFGNSVRTTWRLTLLGECQVKNAPPGWTIEMTGVARRRWAPVTWWWSHRQPTVGMCRSLLQCWIFIAQSHASIDQWKCMLPYAYKPPWCAKHQPLCRISKYCNHPLGQWGCRARRCCMFYVLTSTLTCSRVFGFYYRTLNLNPSSYRYVLVKISVTSIRPAVWIIYFILLVHPVYKNIPAVSSPRKCHQNGNVWLGFVGRSFVVLVHPIWHSLISKNSKPAELWRKANKLVCTFESIAPPVFLMVPVCDREIETLFRDVSHHSTYFHILCLLSNYMYIFLITAPMCLKYSCRNCDTLAFNSTRRLCMFVPLGLTPFHFVW